MSQQARFESLKSRHANLDSRIVEEDHRPQPNQDALHRLKLEKLRVKQEMERLQQSS